MGILLLGATGRTGRQLATQLHDAGETPRVLIRDPARRAQFDDCGAQALVIDLRDDFSRAFDGIQTVIYAAGSSDHEGVEVERAIDRDAIVAATRYAQQYRCQCFVLISTLLANDPSQAPEALRHYATMKRESDQHVIDSDLDYLILRPTELSDDAPTGAIDLLESPGRAGRPVSRADVARLTVAAWQSGLRNRIIGFGQGTTPIDAIVDRLAHATATTH